MHAHNKDLVGDYKIAAGFWFLAFALWFFN
jgi:hypothetical protein